MQKIDELFDLTGKTAVITGASYGLGVTFSHALAQQGVNLILAARSAEKLNEVARIPRTAWPLSISGAMRCTQVSDSLPTTQSAKTGNFVVANGVP